MLRAPKESTSLTACTPCAPPAPPPPLLKTVRARMQTFIPSTPPPPPLLNTVRARAQTSLPSPLFWFEPCTSAWPSVPTMVPPPVMVTSVTGAVADKKSTSPPYVSGSLHASTAATPTTAAGSGAAHPFTPARTCRHATATTPPPPPPPLARVRQPRARIAAPQRNPARRRQPHLRCNKAHDAQAWRTPSHTWIRYYRGHGHGHTCGNHARTRGRRRPHRCTHARVRTRTPPDHQLRAGLDDQGAAGEGGQVQGVGQERPRRRHHYGAAPRVRQRFLFQRTF